MSKRFRKKERGGGRRGGGGNGEGGGGRYRNWLRGVRHFHNTEGQHGYGNIIEE